MTMIDLTQTTAPKSDQLNADDLIGGPKTITVSRVTMSPGTEQPVSLFFDGDDGKPYKPCKSMVRVMVQVWGADASKYGGRSLTLYRDPKVKWGGLEVGGIRISHMSEIKNDVVMALTETRASRKPFTVKPLKAPPAAKSAPVENDATTFAVETWHARWASRVASIDAPAQYEAAAADWEADRPARIAAKGSPQSAELIAAMAGLKEKFGGREEV